MARKLVTVRKIAALDPIPGADAIECATVDGWKLVVKKGEFSVGDKCVYFEIDSWVPHTLAPFLSKGQEPKIYEGVLGNKLRTIKLRGQISQGLAMPLGTADSTIFPEIWQYILSHNLDETSTYEVDFSELLGVKKWEPQLPAELSGQVKGNFPSFIRKTDQERCQNLIEEIFVDNKDAKYEVTIKLDGTSATFYHYNGEVGACSRNLELKLCDENKHNSFVRMLFDSHLNIDLPRLGNVAIQGELMGPGIQGNRENLKEVHFYVFDIYLIDEQRYATPEERKEMFDRLMSMSAGCGKISHVPIIAQDVDLYTTLGITNVDQLLQFAEGKSINHPIREGLVFKRVDGRFSFKAISNAFLAKQKD